MLQQIESLERSIKRNSERESAQQRIDAAEQKAAKFIENIHNYLRGTPLEAQAEFVRSVVNGDHKYF